mgnify:CR=1 FL=1
MGTPEGEITFKDVSFEYPDDHNIVFTNLNLSIHKGEKLAIVGPSGGGKTTLCNLIPRFYDVTAGRITIDGQDIKSFTLKSCAGISVLFSRMCTFSQVRFMKHCLWTAGSDGGRGDGCCKKGRRP